MPMNAVMMPTRISAPGTRMRPAASQSTRKHAPERGKCEEHHAVARHGHADRACFLIAEREHVEMAREQQHDDRAHAHRADGQEDMIPATIIEPADRPEKIRLHLALIERRQDGCRDGRKEHADDDAREQQRQHGHAAMAHGKRNRQADREQCADERAGRQRIEAHAREPCRNRENRADRRTARDADDTRIRQRIREDALEHRP